MTKKQRRYLFHISILLFIIIGTAVVSYALGWRFDISTFKIRKAGAIYIKSSPRDVKIYLNGELVKQNAGFFEAGIFINSLFPKNYGLKLAIDGYKPWERTLGVNPSLVSEAKYAVLIPETATPVLAGPIKNFWIINDKLLIQNKDNNLIWNNKKIPGDQIIGITNDSKKILTEDSKTDSYFWNDLEISSSTDISKILKKSGAAPLRILVDSENNSLIIVRSKSLYYFDPETKIVSPAIASSTASMENVLASRYQLAWTTYKNNTSSLFIYDKFLNKLSDNKFVMDGKTVKMEWDSANHLGILQSDGGFFVYDAGNKELKRTAANARDFKFTADGSMATILENNAIEVFSLKNAKDYWRFSFPDAEKISSLEWYKDNHHLFLIYSDKTDFLDLDDLAKENIQTAAETNKIKYNASANELYFLKSNELVKIEFPS